MRILLIRPNSIIQTLAPPTGLLYIAAMARQVMDVRLDFIDGRLERLDEAGMRKRMAPLMPDLVGITAIMNEVPGVVEAARIARELWPDVPQVLGGPWPSSAPEDALTKTGADVVVKGEGERTFQEIVLRVEAGGKLHGIAGTICRANGRPRRGAATRSNAEDGEFVTGEPRALIENLDSLPYPAYDAVPLEQYLTNWRNGQNRLQRSTRVMPMFTSRGCPHNCIYCHNIFGKRFRERSVGHVIEELELLIKRYRVEEIEISDDIFNFDLPRAKRIAREIIDRRLRVRLSFPNGLRADRMDEELIDLLWEAGAKRISYAIESASPRIQKSINKHVNLEKTFHIIRYTADKGMNVGGFFMFGFPGENAEDMEESIRFAEESALDTASFFYLAPFPGTRLAEQFPEAAKAQFRDYSEFPVNLSAISDEELTEVRKRAYRRFYLNGRRIYRNIQTSPKNFMLVRNAWATARLFVMGLVLY